jgi:RNA polymerase sigma-70 factor (ECF subfamily)
MKQRDLEKEFLEAFRSYSDAIFRFCMVKVSNVELAEDFTQEVFMRYWQALRSGKEMTNTRSFLYTIANNLAKDWYKRKKADSLDAKMESGYEPRGSVSGAETDASYAEVLSVIEDMEDGDREVLLLRHVEGFDPKEIAGMLDESANTISVRLNRAMKRLQEKLHI